MDDSLSKDGSVYLLAAPPARWLLRARLRRAGLRRWQGFLHYPDAASGRHLVPLRRETLLFALRQAWPAMQLRRVAAAVLWLPGVQDLLERFAPNVGLLGRLDETPLAPWSGAESAGGEGLPIITGSGEGGGRVVARYFPPGARQPTIMAKFARGDSGTARIAAEAKPLRTVATGAATDGVRVPLLISEVCGHDGGMLLQSVLPGRTARSALTARPERLDSLLHGLADWLGFWHLRTLHPSSEPVETLRAAVERPAIELESLPSGYRDWLRACCDAAGETALPLAAAHQDLTTSNILWSDQGLGIVTGRPRPPPRSPSSTFRTRRWTPFW